MQPSPNCPCCRTPVHKAELIVVETDLQRTMLSGPLPARGFGYVCPNPQCGILLPIWPEKAGESIANKPKGEKPM